VDILGTEIVFYTIDLLLAATAFDHHLRIVTRNTADFKGLGLTVVLLPCS